MLAGWNRRLSRPWTRRAAAAVGVLGLVAAAALFAFRQAPGVRLLASRALEAAHALREAPGDYPRNTGPADETGLATSESSIAKRLRIAWPHRSIEVATAGDLELAPSEIFFQADEGNSDQARTFAEQTEAIRRGAANPEELCQRWRSTTAHSMVEVAIPATEPFVILGAATRRQPMTCQHFAVGYIALAAAQGWTARLLGLSEYGTAWDHAVVEVADPLTGRWRLIDPDFNVGYRRAGQWLDAREIQEAWFRVKKHFGDIDAQALRKGIEASREDVKRIADVEVVPFGPAGEDLRVSNMRPRVTGMNLEFFEYVVYSARDDYVGRNYPKGHPRRSRQFVLSRGAERATPEICPEAVVIHDSRRLYFTVGATRIGMEKPRGDGMVDCRFTTFTPRFLRFEVSLDGSAWKESPTSGAYRWGLRPGEQTLAARSISQTGLVGPEARLRIVIGSEAKSVGQGARGEAGLAGGHEAP